jgi:site-specific DNA recombinase
MVALPEPTTGTTRTTRGRPRYVAPVLPRVAALYCRVSTKRQGEDDKASLPTQLAALQALAADLGYAVDDLYTYQDMHSGEELHQRPELTRLRQDAQERRFGLVLAYNVYALAKNTAHMAILKDDWDQIGIGLQFAIEELEDTPLGRMILSARTFAAEVEGERRKDRMQRALMAQVQRGKPASGKRPPYGYQWPDVRDARTGKLKKDRLERDPLTWPVVERIWREALGGRTLRAMAAGLTRDRVPTPSGQSLVWDPVTVRYLLTNPLYWGQPVALRRKLVPVEPHLRKHYAHKSKPVARPIEEQVPLPADYAPAVVSPDVAERVQMRLRLQQRLATPQNPDPQELLRGIARCGYCEGGLLVAHHQGRWGRPRSTYRCRKGNRLNGTCAKHGIEAHTLDAAAWAKVSEVLTHPALIEQELERMRAMPDPGADTLASIDRQLADLRRRIKNKRDYAERVDDDRERGEVAAEVTLLCQQERKLEAERVATVAHFADWREQQEGLQQTLDWCARVAGNLDTFTLAERRQTLLTLKAEVRLYRVGHTPYRAELTIHLPLSGALALELSGLGGMSDDVHGVEHGLMCCKLTR